MVNDINTLNGALSELGETMADNLVSMGVVDASASDGLTTLAGKILDIEPSIGGLDLDTAVTISSSESSISLGSSIVLTSKLTASYDDETIVDVDLSGVLQNATLLFKNGNTTIGTAVTDVNGVATFTYTPPSVGTLSLKTIFAGTDNFNNCESSFINVTVVAPSYDDIVLTADDSILSYYDGDSTTLRAQLMDGTSTASVSGVTVEFFNGSTSLGTAQTDSNGVAVKTYTSTGAGDVSLKAEADNGMIVSEIFGISDYYYYDNLTVDKSRYTTVSGSPVLTYSSNGLNVNTSVAQVGLVKNNFLTLPSDYEAELTVTYVTSNARTGICFDDLLVDGGDTNTGIYKLSTTTRQSNITNSTYRTGDVVKIRKQGSTFTYYLNNVQKWTGTISDDNHLQQFRTYQNRSTTFKDLKIKSL